LENALYKSQLIIIIIKPSATLPHVLDERDAAMARAKVLGVVVGTIPLSGLGSSPIKKILLNNPVELFQG